MKTYMDLFCSLSCDQKYVLNIIQKNGPLTKGEILEKTDYSMTHLNRLLSPLETCGLVQRKGTADSTGGRKPALFDINCTDYFVIGVSTGSARLAISISDLKLHILASRHYPMLPAYTPQKVVEIAQQTVGELLEQLHLQPSQIMGIGLGAFGAIDRKKGLILRQSQKYLHPSWWNAPIVQLFEEAFHLPVVFDMSINGELLMQHNYGMGKDCSKLLVVTCGMSIKSAFFSHNQIIRTSNNREDAFGHMTINIDGEPCHCGNYGCIDCYSSVPAILQRFSSQIKLGRPSSLQSRMDQLTIQEIGQAASQGDALALEVLEYGARVLGCGLSNYINLLSPHMVILSGLIIDASEMFYQNAVETAKQKLSCLAPKNQVVFCRAHSDLFTTCSPVLFIENFLNNSY
ncbi:MAG: ROK family transcriptional regulator [Eubacteriales bacterium]|jgi:predicted NBD/HSP70 family sugar kinase